MRYLILFLFAVMPLLFIRQAWADVYKFVDGSGHVIYTDKPKHRGFRLIIRTPPALLQASRAQAPNSFTRNFGISRTAAMNRLAYSPLIEATASKYDLDPALLHAVIRAESAYNPGAVSNKGAAGLMQLMPGTAARFGVRDRFDPEENIEGGARYLSELLDMFQSDVRLAVAAYNSGENTVKKFGYQIPPIAETQDYVARVLNYYRR